MRLVLEPAPEAIRRLYRTGWLVGALGVLFTVFVLFEGASPWSQRLLAVALFGLPFLWGGLLFLREARSLAHARLVLEDDHLRYRLPRGGRLPAVGEVLAGELPVAAVEDVGYRQRPLLELIFLSALRPRGTFSRHVFVIRAGGTVLELDPALWPGADRFARRLAETLAARTDETTTPTSEETVP